MVVICALCISVSCLSRWAFPGFASTLPESAWVIRSRIWAAAALVKVTTSSLSISTGCSASLTIWMIRSTNTAVFPLPAAADTRILLSLASIVAC